MTSIADKIIALKDADLELRNKLVQSGELWDGYNSEMEDLHIHNSKELETIINEIGFPTIDKVGREAYEAGWLVIQHSISRPTFMKKCMALLEKELVADKADHVLLAYLTDRIAVLEGNPQLYGTQFDWNNQKELAPNHYDDLDKVNQRRKSIGLNTLEEQTLVIKNRAKTENETPPSNLIERNKEMEVWKKSVGWI